MGAKKKTKNKTVKAALQKGTVPTEIDFRKDRQDTWANLGNIAQGLYDTPLEAIDILLKGSTLFKTRNVNTFVLCAKIEKDIRKTNLNLNKFIEQNLEKYCPMIGQDYSKVAKYTAREIQKDPSKQQRHKIDRQQIVNQIVEKHRRLVKNNPQKFKDWLKSNSHLVK